MHNHLLKVSISVQVSQNGNDQSLPKSMKPSSSLVMSMWILLAKKAKIAV